MSTTKPLSRAKAGPRFRTTLSASPSRRVCEMATRSRSQSRPQPRAGRQRPRRPRAPPRTIRKRKTPVSKRRFAAPSVRVPTTTNPATGWIATRTAKMLLPVVIQSLSPSPRDFLSLRTATAQIRSTAIVVPISRASMCSRHPEARNAKVHRLRRSKINAPPSAADG